MKAGMLCSTTTTEPFHRPHTEALIADRLALPTEGVTDRQSSLLADAFRFDPPQSSGVALLRQLSQSHLRPEHGLTALLHADDIGSRWRPGHRVYGRAAKQEEHLTVNFKPPLENDTKL